MLLPSDGTCVLSCPVGFYSEDRDERECERCHFSCQSCVGRHSGQCVTCKAGFFRQGSSCVEHCSERSAARRDARRLLICSRLTSPPPFSHFGNTMTMECDLCDPSCNQCWGRGNRKCLSCRKEFILVKKWGQCLQSCPTGFYLEERSRTCRKCHPTCKTCSGKDNPSQ